MIGYYTAAEIAAAWKRPIGTIHRLASVERWRRARDQRRPALYYADDVDRTMARLAEWTLLDTVTCGEV